VSKLSKQAAKLHNEAVALARCGRRLTCDEREFVVENFHEGAEHMNGLAGAFFTPPGLARDASIEVGSPKRLLDLCAGIGALSYASESEGMEIVCVELNPAYVEIGRAVMPDATWICASAFDLAAYAHLGPFDVVVSNPPFGRIKADGFAGKYTGGLFEYRLIEIANRVARRGVFILPQQSAPFRYSGQACFRTEETEECAKFGEQTGIVMEPNCGIDTACYRKEWRGISPMCEVVCCDFEQKTGQLDLLASAA
jgi:Methyltransferase small domain